MRHLKTYENKSYPYISTNAGIIKKEEFYNRILDYINYVFKVPKGSKILQHSYLENSGKLIQIRVETIGKKYAKDYMVLHIDRNDFNEYLEDPELYKNRKKFDL